MSHFSEIPLPPTWGTAPIGKVAEINPGLNKSKIDDRLVVAFVPMPAVEAESGRIDVSAARHFGEVKKGYTAFCEGDVLFAKITPCMENGKMAIVPALRNGLGFGSTEFHVLRPREGISAQYLYYFVSAQQFRRDAEHNMTGAVGQRRVPMPYLAQHTIPIPPEPEQRRIVAKIEELFSKFDKGVESLTTAREQLKTYRLSVLKAAFEGRLTADWRAKNHGPEWNNARFGDYFRLQGGYAFKSDDYCEAGVPLIRIGDIQGDRVFPSDKTALLPASYLDENRSFVVIDGDILVAMSGATTGKFGIYSGQHRSLLNQRVGRVLTRQSEIEIPRRLVWYFLMRSQHEILRRAYGGAQPNISAKGIEDLDFSFPSSQEEMVLLVSRLEAALSRNDDILETISTELSRGEALRQSILKRAFSGQLVAQNSADEPASVLLDRIHAEREGGGTTKRGNNKNGKKEAA